MAAGAAASLAQFPIPLQAASGPEISVKDLPSGAGPLPVSFPYFPTRLHAFVWRNWPLVPIERMARVVGAKRGDMARLGGAMGLGSPPRISRDQQRRSALTVIKRNWQLLPYEQLLDLLGWTPAELAYTLREDDFLYIKLGSLKPRCEPIRYAPSDAATQAREAEMARVVKELFPRNPARTQDPLFGFVGRLSTPVSATRTTARAAGPTVAPALSPRFCYSYFALYGDPLLDRDLDPYPDGFLARLADAGVDGVWLQAVLYKLAPFPWQLELSNRHEERLANLGSLVARAKRHGINVYLYLNEPRAMPLAFHAAHPGLKGVGEGDYAALCTSQPDVRRYLRDSVSSICRAVPDLGGFFTITGSENLTNCWSHSSGAGCPRCAAEGPAKVIAGVNELVCAGIRDAGSRARLLAWDWGWADDWAPGIISLLPAEATLMSVSEWSIPIHRGGVETTVGEYSISTIGPGPRARKHWDLARARGLRTVAKIQAGCTWELSAVPYIPAVANVARHAANLLEARVNGLMLGWTLGGCPSPNLEVVAALASDAAEQPGRPPDPEAAMRRVAERRFGATIAPEVVRAWQVFSTAFSEFPFHGGLVYNAPMQVGPSNPLWATPTGYHASMVGFPYDDLDGWRQVYPPEVFIGQFEKVAEGFERGLADLRLAERSHRTGVCPEERQALHEELGVAEAAGIHFRSTANQARFVLARSQLASAQTAPDKQAITGRLESLVRSELALARRLYEIQSGDSRIGFEASNQYYYVPLDLVEKALNCRWLLDQYKGQHGA